LKIPNRRWLWEQIGELKPEQGTGLIFCQYREEVRHWESKLLSLGFRCWSCVGGEAQGFSTLVRTQLPPDFIIATTVLSHGVNLPRISRVFFTYPVKNRDFWIQMVARGGRKGEPFDVFSVEKPTGLQWNKYTNYLAIRRLDLKMSGRKFFRAIQEWFLKAS
jgi:superfamily II DNA or RNA helicase